MHNFNQNFIRNQWGENFCHMTFDLKGQIAQTNEVKGQILALFAPKIANLSILDTLN